MAGSMVDDIEKQSVLFLPDKFMDHRMWSDIPDRIGSAANAAHFDQLGEMPWTGDDHQFLDVVRDRAPRGSFDLVAAAHEADRLAFALAEAGLARGVALFQPAIPWSAIPDGVRPDTSGLDIDQIFDEAAGAYGPLTDAILHDPDAGRRRAALVSFARDYAGVSLEPPELELAVGMFSDHAEEIAAAVRAFAAAEAEDDAREQARPARSWEEQFGSVAMPMVLIVARRARPVADAVVAGRPIEVVTADGMGGLALPPDRATGADTILRVLDRVRHG